MWHHFCSNKCFSMWKPLSLCYALTTCISCFSVARMKHHDQGILRKEKFVWLIVPEGLRAHGSRAKAAGMVTGAKVEGSHLEPQAWKRGDTLGKVRVIKLSKSIPSDRLRSLRTHLLNLPKQGHHCGSSLQTSKPMGGILIQVTTPSLKSPTPNNNTRTIEFQHEFQRGQNIPQAMVFYETK